MALSERDFDQDLDGGWRKIAANPDCRSMAADLIRDYRRFHAASSRMLVWHEGQLRAELGQMEEALALFEQSYIVGNDPSGWNWYVDATLAFLRKDRAALLQARARLASMPKPDGFAPSGPDGRPLPIPWPPNLNAVDGLIACFDEPYAVAYSARCTVPLKLETP